MNIAFFNLSKVAPFTGGIERVTYNLSNYFRGKGIRVFFFVLRGTEDDKYFVLPTNKEFVPSYIDRKVRENDIEIIIDQYGIGNYMSHKALKSDVKIIRCVHLSLVAKHISSCLLETFTFNPRRFKKSMLNFLFWLNTPNRERKQRKGGILRMNCLT